MTSATADSLAPVPGSFAFSPVAWVAVPVADVVSVSTGCGVEKTQTASAHRTKLAARSWIPESRVIGSSSCGRRVRQRS
ncbi:MAG: hypothetical protein OXC08_09985 [Thiotrichales bacterium]|nr:hypothetical protein [Thiotrichales bacterium]